MDEAQGVRLGSQIRQRRLELRLSVRAAAARAKIDRSTWSTAEDGTRRLSQHLWPSVEDALRWERGSIEAVVDGGEPTSQAGGKAGGSGGSLADEVERIGRLPGIRPADRIRMIQALVALYEEDAAFDDDQGD